MDAALSSVAESLFGEELKARAGVTEGAPSPDDPDEQDVNDSTGELAAPLLHLHLTARETRTLWHHVEAVVNFWQTLDETEPGIIARLAGLAADRRWEVIFLTRRPETAGATAQVQTQRWLEAKGFPLPSVYVVQGSRGRIASALGLDTVIDDRPENCLDVVVDSRARAILVWRDDQRPPPHAAKRLGIGVVSRVSECLDALVEMDSAPADRPGVLERVMKMLGLGVETVSV